MNALLVCKCGHDRTKHGMSIFNKLICVAHHCNCIEFTLVGEQGMVNKEGKEVSSQRYLRSKVSDSCHTVTDTTIDSVICYCPKSEYADLIIEGLQYISILGKEQVKLAQMEVKI